MTELQVLPPGAGYGIVIGIGGVFALFMLGLTWLQNRYTAFSTHQSEEFNTASRSIKPGLISAGIVSSWTWSATLLTSSTFAYTYGVCGPMWYGAVGTLQILLFSLIAIKIKAHAPGAHTMPEIVRARHGTAAHLTYLYNGLATNMLVGACLVLGGAQVVAAMTGMNVYAATFLIPAVVVAYVIAGGLRSTFIADYTHTVILLVAILVFGLSVAASSDLVGSPRKLYELLQQASREMPIERNTEGSYLAFRSVGGLIFAVDIFVAGFTTVWLDQAYWQRAIASRPETSVKAYLLGGIAWYGIPFGFATAMGLGCAALTNNPAFPTYPHPLSPEQVAAGLSAPATAITLLGKGGAVLMLILLFMAVTSSTSAELIAVSSLLTFDVYKTYFRPHTDSATLVRVSHWAIVLYAVLLAAFCSVLNAVGLSLTWVLTVLGVIVGGAAMPAGLVLLWGRMSTVAAVVAPWIGFVCGVVVWFVTSSLRSGAINVETTGDVTNAMAGNLASFGTGAISAVVLSLIFPKKSPSAEAAEVFPRVDGAVVVVVNPPESETSSRKDDEDQKEVPHPAAHEATQAAESGNIELMDPKVVRKAERLAQGANLVFILVAVVLVPFTLFGSSYVYSERFFTGWVVVSLVWIWASVIICVVWPVVESAGALGNISGGLWMDMRALMGVRKKNLQQGPA
ncbi:sodium:solute symporter family protein [Aspergillus clavatus NRRL 1]|uniref:Solute symporter family transporter n=1 Tax=Aspergillus clavatus (strain ATCC 1007 / CBS 513.65 / DSM 816 / NCTC 3887 / NRRL 1 / QM 1276 / 107) TaxID=344612 RepID=A1CMK0_ASPCL|nr:solute symporter family transporter [Aspergillus clavatus NRRL 1]EAW08787.1 solute symporter family transporter [Aspergillus clavatus NRRL 1]